MKQLFSLSRRWDSLGLRWVFGLAITVLGVGAFFFNRVQIEPFETAQYIFISTAVPAIALLLGFRSRSRFPAFASRIFKAILAIVFICFSGYYTYKFATLPLVILALCQLLLMGWFSRKWIIEGIREQRWVELGAYSISVGAVCFLSWVLAAKMIWWRIPQDWSTESNLVWYLVIASAAVISLGLASSSLNQKKWRFLDVAAVLFFLLPSMRVNFQIFHTSFYVGPANLVRNGGWLLWDVPSQYGFLNVLLLGTLPGVSSWQAFWILNGTLVFISACIMYALMRTMMTGVRGVFASFLGTLGAVFFLPGWAPELTGPTAFPSTGAMRFIFPYALMALTFWNVKMNGPKLWSRRVLGFWHYVWFLGFLCAV